MCLLLIQHIQTAIKSVSTHMTTVFHARSDGTFIEIKHKPRRKKLQETNQGFNFLVAVLAIATI